ncbi:pirin family protein [Pelagibius litoralis]|uniref:Pirin family protein n=1 Tax=Pelagibius litoralis TaxID=374515 RepID=A0A967F1V8_9PROT|nr:pirin family protein [Pelagibius litoralis]NIA71636.1 pirin family protein [Pelagibius litoralis]
MIEIKTFDDLGRFQNDWLSARYHFSFADYYDPARMGFGPLRVWNDDKILPGTGFDLHGHRDMEIITYVREGAITHKDHLGNEGRTEAGDVQVMSAGSGIMHAEFNREDEATRIFQIWIEPAVHGVEPRWEARAFPKAERAGELVALASGRRQHQEALPIYQDAAILGATLTAGQAVSHDLDPGRKLYLVPAKGSITVNGVKAGERDGIAINDVDRVEIIAETDAEILLADVA